MGFVGGVQTRGRVCLWEKLELFPGEISMWFAVPQALYRVSRRQRNTWFIMHIYIYYKYCRGLPATTQMGYTSQIKSSAYFTWNWSKPSLNVPLIVPFLCMVFLLVCLLRLVSQNKTQSLTRRGQPSSRLEGTIDLVLSCPLSQSPYQSLNLRWAAGLTSKRWVEVSCLFLANYVQELSEVSSLLRTRRSNPWNLSSHGTEFEAFSRAWLPKFGSGIYRIRLKREFWAPFGVVGESASHRSSCWQEQNSVHCWLKTMTSPPFFQAHWTI